ncbi:MAG TPA: glycosyltransferase [Chitinophagaceae bacterium]|nr:glycosyltransferase [Chitinophagaceae bacterium]
MGKEKKVILLTSGFPYAGEHFLEEEIKYWSSNFSGELIILPTIIHDNPRKIPANIKVDTSLARELNIFPRVKICIQAFFSSIFFKEVIYVLRQFKFSHPKCFWIAFQTTRITLGHYHKLKEYIEINRAENFLIYSYWFDTAAYAAALLKKQNLVRNLVTRCHGFDVYENRRPYSYMPLKRQFRDYFDIIFAISEQGKNYLQSTYGINKDKISISRLGVEIPDKISHSSKNYDALAIVSVSNCIKVKRIDRIIKGIGLFSTNNKSVHIIWHHIGGGDQLDNLMLIAAENFENLNITWKFPGEMPNTKVKEFLGSHEIDVIINTSDSEGTPVSIMEAMSYEIPAIAPNIGGISELVNRNNGLLLKAAPDVYDICEALAQMKRFKDPETRKNARLHIVRYFNAEVNYRKFIELLQDLI